jgi:hypothetical protein
MHARLAVAFVSAVMLGSCLPGEPAAPDAHDPEVRLLVRANLSGTAIATVIVNVTAADIPAMLVFNIPVVNGVASGTITVPAGSNRTITLRAFDAGGIETHEGSTTVNIQPGTNPTISITLLPLIGDVPITVTLGSFTVTLQPPSLALAPNDTATLTATVLDANGSPVTDQVVWASLAPTVATVVSTGPRTGRVTAKGNGQTTVVAVYGGTAGSAAIAVASSGGIFPLHVEAGKRYLVDAHGNPFLMHGDAAWSLIAQLTREDAEAYLEDRRQKGFNTVIVNLIEHYFADHPPNNVYGDAPFLTPGDFTTPNEAYFAHAEYVINLAAQKGMLVLLFPDYMGIGGGDQGWWNEMVANGPTKLATYGAYIAQRFRAYDNIIWVHGADFNPPDLTLVRPIPNAIRAVDTKWLQTFDGARSTSALGLVGTGESWLGVNQIYTDFGNVISIANTEYARSTLPFFLTEAVYEGDIDQQLVRQEAYQAVLSGATGEVMGNNAIWEFASGWQQALDSPGARTLKYLPALLTSLAWWTLVPDTAHSVINNGVVTTARASDGSLVVAYMPVSTSWPVDMGQLSGPHVVARWYDPANGTFKSISGSPFVASGVQYVPSPGGVNSSGFEDWVLVLESAP